MRAKKINLILLALMYILNSSCQSVGTIYPTATKYNNTSSITQSANVWETKTPTFTESPILWPLYDTSEEIIFIGEESGDYIAVGVVSSDITSFSLDGKCQVLANRYEALCLNNQLFLINLGTGTKTEYPISRPAFWSVTPDESLIYYALIDNDPSVRLFLFNPLEETTTNITLIEDPRDWPVFPRVSAGGKYFAGVHQAGSIYLLSMFNIANNTYEEIQGFNGYLTDIAWSPVSQVVGIGSSDRYGEDISPCNSDIFSTFDISSGEIIQHLLVSESECILGFRSFTNNIWSPDGTKIVLVAQNSITYNKALWILDIKNATQTSINITRPGERLDRIAWSPDSQSLAYIVSLENSKRSLRVVNGNDLTQIVFTEDFSFSPWINDFVWTAP